MRYALYLPKWDVYFSVNINLTYELSKKVFNWQNVLKSITNNIISKEKGIYQKDENCTSFLEDQ